MILAMLLTGTALFSQRPVCQMSFVAEGRIFNGTDEAVTLWAPSRENREMFALKVDSIVLLPGDTTKISQMEWAGEFRPPWEFYEFRTSATDVDGKLNDKDKWTFIQTDETTGYFIFSIDQN